MQPFKTAEQLNEEKENIIGLLLHDLKPPLQVLRFLTGHLSAGNTHNLSAEMVQGYLQELNMAVEELVQSSAAIFTWLEVQRDRFLQPAQPSDLRTLLQEAVAQFQKEVPNHKAQFQLPAALDLTATVDGNAVRIILQQLLRNATAANAGGTVMLNAWKDNNIIWLSVQDEGKGMSDRVISNIQAHLAGDGSTPVLYRYGYRIIIRVLQLLQAQIQFDTTVGTTVSIGVPIKA